MKKLLRCFFFWRVRYPDWEEFKTRIQSAYSQGQPVVIVTHDVGLCVGNKPGGGNMLLAKALKRVTETYPAIPVFAQLGVAMAARELGIPIAKVIGPPSADTPLNRSTGEYNTWTVINAQKHWCQEHRLFPALALTLAIPLHMGRVTWVMEKEGFTVLPIPLLSVRGRDYTDKKSLYRSIRISGAVPCGILVLYAREILAWLLFLKRGRM